MRRRNFVEEDSDSERWMVSYADFITLLFGFFVVMYAISSVNDEKYRVLSATLAQAFEVDASSPQIIQTGEPALSASPHVVDLPDEIAFADQDDGDTFIQNPQDDPVAASEGFAAQEGVSLHSNADWFEMNLSAGVLFGVGQAQLSGPGRAALRSGIQVGLQNDLPITIEGYTDNVPSQGRLYPSNWELSAARASAVARFMVESGIRQERISAVGYGENHPVATNATPDGRAQNRRIVLVMARKAGLSRNLNSGTETSAIALVRQSGTTDLDGVVQNRTDDGGLLFTNQ